MRPTFQAMWTAITSRSYKQGMSQKYTKKWEEPNPPQDNSSNQIVEHSTHSRRGKHRKTNYIIDLTHPLAQITNVLIYPKESQDQKTKQKSTNSGTLQSITNTSTTDTENSPRTDIEENLNNDLTTNNRDASVTSNSGTLETSNRGTSTASKRGASATSNRGASVTSNRGAPVTSNRGAAVTDVRNVSVTSNKSASETNKTDTYETSIKGNSNANQGNISIFKENSTSTNTTTTNKGGHPFLDTSKANRPHKQIMQLRKDIQKRKYLDKYNKNTLKEMAATGIITSTAQVGLWHDE